MSLLSICNIVLLFLVIVLLFLVLLYFNAERFYYFYLRLREESPPILKIVDPDAIHLNNKAIWIERFKEKLKILIPILIFIAIIAMGPYILNFAVLAIWTAPGIYYIITEDALGIVSVTATVVFPLVWDRIWEYQPHQTRINRQNYSFISSAWLLASLGIYWFLSIWTFIQSEGAGPSSNIEQIKETYVFLRNISLVTHLIVGFFITYLIWRRGEVSKLGQ